MMAKGTPLRNIRIDDELWQAAAEVANERQESLSEVMRQFLRDYIATHGANTEPKS